jgi:hypothetical protein
MSWIRTTLFGIAALFAFGIGPGLHGTVVMGHSNAPALIGAGAEVGSADGGFEWP